MLVKGAIDDVGILVITGPLLGNPTVTFEFLSTVLFTSQRVEMRALMVWFFKVHQAVEQTVHLPMVWDASHDTQKLYIIDYHILLLIFVFRDSCMNFKSNKHVHDILSI